MPCSINVSHGLLIRGNHLLLDLAVTVDVNPQHPWAGLCIPPHEIHNALGQISEQPAQQCARPRHTHVLRGRPPVPDGPPRIRNNRVVRHPSRRSLAFVILNFNEKPLRNDAVDDAIERLANASHEKLDLLVLDGSALSLSRGLFHVGKKATTSPFIRGCCSFISAQ